MSEKNQYSTDLPPSYEVSSGFSQNAYATPGSVQAGYTSVGYSSGHVTTPHTSFPACSPGVGMTHQPGGPLPEAYQKMAQCWFITAIVTCIFLFPLGIPAAIFCHKAKKAAERGDNFEYLKYLKIGRILAGAGIGLSIVAIINLSIQLPLRLGGREDVNIDGADGIYRYSTSTPQKRWKSMGTYIGCYPNPPELFSKPPVALRESSVYSCLSHCSFGGYTYAGIEDSNKCSCGDTYGYGNLWLENYKCDSYCSDESYGCGGDNNQTSIYSTKYLGCYNGSLAYEMDHIGDAVKPETCFSVCQRKGFDFVGLIDGGKCFCDLYYIPASRKLNDDLCDFKCKADPNSICGSKTASVVFPIH